MDDSHRSGILYAMPIRRPEVPALSTGEVIAPVVPMFHINAWEWPDAAMMVGAKRILPRPNLDAANPHALFDAEGRFATGDVVPMDPDGFRQHVRDRGADRPSGAVRQARTKALTTSARIPT